VQSAGKIDIGGAVTGGAVDIGFTDLARMLVDPSRSIVPRSMTTPSWSYSRMAISATGWATCCPGLCPLPPGCSACVGDLCTFDWTDPWSAQGSVSNITAWVIEGSGDQDVPLPGAVWLFGSALVGLVTLSRVVRVA